MNEVPIPAEKVYELQPYRIYVLEVDESQVSRKQMVDLADKLRDMNISLTVVPTRNGKALRFIPDPTGDVEATA